MKTHDPERQEYYQFIVMPFPEVPRNILRSVPGIQTPVIAGVFGILRKVSLPDLYVKGVNACTSLDINSAVKVFSSRKFTAAWSGNATLLQILDRVDDVFIDLGPGLFQLLSKRPQVALVAQARNLLGHLEYKAPPDPQSLFKKPPTRCAEEPPHM